jgi:hypothetical protein
MNTLAKMTEIDKRNFELVKDKEEFLHDLYNYIPNLMIHLWNNPNIVTKILKNSEIEDVKNHLAPLFVNNFYENILSSYFIEENLIYVLTLLLKEEIDELNSPNEYKQFLNNSTCSYLLEEFRKKIDIKTYLKTIISESIKDLEEDNTNLDISFDTTQLAKRFDNKNNKESKIKKEEFITNNFISLSFGSFIDNDDFRYKKKLRKQQEIFNQKYIVPLNKHYLEEALKTFQGNQKMCEFINTKILECNEDTLIFSNKDFIDENIYKSPNPQIVFLLYQNYFMSTINFIDLIMKKIINNFQSMPYSIKSICKIISLLISKKFPSIKESEKIIFISKFFFEKLIIPAIENPGIEAFISDFIISQKTLDNLKEISEIMHKFTLGEFYKSKDKNICFTPFNLYFLEKMDNLFNIFENTIKVNLPSFIDKFINNELPSDYHYNYFTENPDEIITHRSILFNLDQAKALLQTINKIKKEIFCDKKYNKLEKTVEKLMNKNNQNLLNNLLLEENKSQEVKSKRRGSKIYNNFEALKLHFFLETSVLYNEKYKNLFEIEQNTPNFSLKELSSTPDEESITENNIIKVKNFFSSLLYNNNKLSRTDFEEGKTENTKTILMELKNFMKSSNFVLDESIPSEWYVISLLEYLEKIPSNLTENDCKELYNQIENDVNNSIKELDFDLLSLIIGKLKYSKRTKNFYDKSLIILKDVKLNNISKDIIENKIIPVDIVFHFDESEVNHIFQINSSNFKIKDKNNHEKINDYLKKQKWNTKLCLTINDFTKNIPNLVKYQEFQDIDVLEFQKKLEFPEKINHYISLIKEYIIKNSEYFDDSIMEKIYDYIMSKIYNKIYPIEPYEQDTKIYQQSIRLSWIQLKNLAQMKMNFVFGSFLTDISKYINLIDSEKSPNKKIFNVSEIFNSIRFLLKFNGGGKDIGVDDQLPLLNYVIIKTAPLRIYSNAKFMELYIGERKSKSEGNQLTQLLSLCEHIIKIDHSQLIDVSLEEFKAKCNASAINSPDDSIEK